MIDPEIECLVVLLVGGVPETIGIETVALDHQFVSPLHRFRLEIVAETEVAHHLEE